MRNLLLAVFVLAYSSSAVAQNKHPFSFEDMMAFKRVEEPVPSPDGKWVLFAAVDVDLKANTKTPHVWVVPIAGGKEQEIISDQDADRPRWAPDGKRFAFVSTKESGSQIWIADFDGKTGTVIAKHRLTNFATEADGELWTPNGYGMLFVSNVYPECDGLPEQEEACNARKLEEAKNSKVSAQIFAHLFYRHWNAYKEGRRSHLFMTPLPIPFATPEPTALPADYLPKLFPRDLTPGDHDVPPFHLGGQDMYIFSPDGTEICYTSNHDEVEATSTNNDLFIVPVYFGANDSPAQVLAQTKNITADNRAADETPLYSPDGKYIAYRAQTRPGYESDRWRLMLYDRKTGEKKNLTENLDRWVGTFTWAPDSSRIYFVREEEGKSPVSRVPVPEGFFSTVVTIESGSPGRKRSVPLSTNGVGVLFRGFYDDLSVSRDGKNLFFTGMSLQHPNEIFEASVSDLQKVEEPHHVTGVNDSVLSQVSMSPLESFWFTGAHGDKVQGFLVKPPNFDPNKKYPVKFLIHGGPQGAWGDDWSYRWNPELFAANGYVVVMINFHGSTGYGQKFIDAINGDWGGAPFEDLMKGLDYAEQHYGFIDKDRECALGASYGGYMANWILGHTNRFKCIVTHDGTFNNESDWGTTEELWFNEWEFKGTPYTNRELYRKWSPHLFATNFKTPTLVVHGQLDYRLDVSEGFQLFTTLQRLGVPSKMLYFPDEGHWVLKPQNSQLWHKTVNDWVDQWVGK